MKYCSLFFLLLISLNVFGQEKTALSELEGRTLENAVRLNFIPVEMPSDKFSSLKPTMGLMGLHYQIPITDWLYGGVAMHAAITGDQGGLFTLGAELGVKKEVFKNIFADANFHFGGGGGYRLYVNDGSFINANVGLKYEQKKYAFGLQYSHLNFYSGEIKSNSVSVFLEIPSVFRFADYKEARKEFYEKNSNTNNFWQQPVTKNVQQVRFDFFSPFGNSKKDNGSVLNETLYVLGFEYQKYISDNAFIYAHTDAIYKGLRAGFMDLFIGGGYIPYQSEKINLFVKFGVGAAGGRVYPEGGLMMYPGVGGDLKLSNNFAVSSHIGYYKAIAGDLEAYTYGFGFKYLGLNGGTKNSSEEKKYTQFKTNGIRISLQNQTYFDVNKTDDLKDVLISDLQLLALQFNVDISKYFYLLGETGFAYDGRSGGYAHGIVGLGIYSPYFLNNRLRAHLELAGGAAGGAGVDTGEGIVMKPTLGLSYGISNGFSVFTSVGKLIAPFGNVNSTNINIGLSFGLSTLSAKK